MITSYAMQSLHIINIIKQLHDKEMNYWRMRENFNLNKKQIFETNHLKIKLDN